jgi:hypothetical protein
MPRDESRRLLTVTLSGGRGRGGFQALSETDGVEMKPHNHGSLPAGIQHTGYPESRPFPGERGGPRRPMRDGKTSRLSEETGFFHEAPSFMPLPPQSWKSPRNGSFCPIGTFPAIFTPALSYQTGHFYLR